MSQTKTAVILTNLGEPENTSTSAVKKFLKQRFSDDRVFNLAARWSRLKLNFPHLPGRTKTIFQLYGEVSTDENNTLSAISRRQQTALQQKLGQQVGVELMMRDGDPSFATVLGSLHARHYRRLIILPLFPQNSIFTTASAFDHISEVFKHFATMPEFTFIGDYHGHPDYIHALAASIQVHWKSLQRQRFLLMSFAAFSSGAVDRDEAYHDQCLGTAHLLATIMGLGSSQWGMSFQPYLGDQGLDHPATAQVLATLAKNGLREIDVVCPGYASDCVHTLVQTRQHYRDIFLQQGGRQYHYIPCLNDADDHIEMMAALLQPYLSITPG